MPIKRKTGLLRCFRKASSPPRGRVPIRADVRIVAATHHDLRGQLSAKGVREDHSIAERGANESPAAARAAMRTTGARQWHLPRWPCARGCPMIAARRSRDERLRTYSWPGKSANWRMHGSRLAALYSRKVDALGCRSDLGTADTSDPAETSNGKGWREPASATSRAILLAQGRVVSLGDGRAYDRAARDRGP